MRAMSVGPARSAGRSSCSLDAGSRRRRRPARASRGSSVAVEPTRCGCRRRPVRRRWSVTVGRPFEGEGVEAASVGARPVHSSAAPTFQPSRAARPPPSTSIVRASPGSRSSTLSRTPPAGSVERTGVREHDPERGHDADVPKHHVRRLSRATRLSATGVRGGARASPSVSSRNGCRSTSSRNTSAANAPSGNTISPLVRLPDDGPIEVEEPRRRLAARRTSSRPPQAQVANHAEAWSGGTPVRRPSRRASALRGSRPPPCTTRSGTTRRAAKGSCHAPRRSVASTA